LGLVFSNGAKRVKWWVKDVVNFCTSEKLSLYIFQGLEDVMQVIDAVKELGDDIKLRVESERCRMVHEEGACVTGCQR
jgi:hypothetical protein